MNATIFLAQTATLAIIEKNTKARSAISCKKDDLPLTEFQNEIDCTPINIVCFRVHVTNYLNHLSICVVINHKQIMKNHKKIKKIGVEPQEFLEITVEDMQDEAKAATLKSVIVILYRQFCLLLNDLGHISNLSD